MSTGTTADGPKNIEEECRSVEKTPSDRCKMKSRVPLDISTSRKKLLTDHDGSTSLELSETSRSLPARWKLLKFNAPTGNLPSPSTKFRHFAEQRDEISRSVPSSTVQVLQKRITSVLSKNIDWSHIIQLAREWIKNPLNMVLLLWVFCVAVSGAILFLVMTGMLNAVLTKKSERDAWFEVNNQILNALFTLMCLYQHPKRFHHLVLLCRWNPNDIARLRSEYCKNGAYKPNEWAHMMVVIGLLHLNCFAQYALCGLNLGYKRSQRPAVGVGICISVAIAAPAIAGLYSILSPLGKDYDEDADDDEEAQKITVNALKQDPVRRRLSFASRDEKRIVEDTPKWRGGLFNLWEDVRVAYLSMFCTLCVFGWNMDRLGFGNMYVHIATFFLLCSAPFFIFNLAAVNIDNDIVREALSITGILLCLFGLLYGGFWRIRMRKRFSLPGVAGNWFCFSKPDVIDCMRWLFCCWCSLAQEVRTADFYDIVDDSFYQKEKVVDDGKPTLTPLSREGEAAEFGSHVKSPVWMRDGPVIVMQRVEGGDNLKPPAAPSSMQREYTDEC